MNLEAALDQRLDHGAVRDLDCDMDLGWYAAARRRQPDRHLGETLAAVPENFLADPAAVLVRQGKYYGSRSPNRRQHTIFVHQSSSFPAQKDEPPQPSPIPVLALGKRTARPARTPHGASIAANSSGHASPPGDRVTGGNWLLPTIFGSVWEEYAALDRRPRVTLRSATLHFARPAACIPETA